MMLANAAPNDTREDARLRLVAETAYVPVARHERPGGCGLKGDSAYYVESEHLNAITGF